MLCYKYVIMKGGTLIIDCASVTMIYSHCVLGQVDRDCPEWVFLLLAKTAKKKHSERRFTRH